MVLKTVAFTGASGMVGKHVAEMLATRGIQGVGISRTQPTDLPTNVSWFPCDLASRLADEQLTKYFSDAEAVFHIGACVPNSARKFSSSDMIDVNVRATLELGEWALSSAVPFVYLSGAIVYLDPERKGISEEDAVGANSIGGFYGLTKWLGEQVLMELARKGLKLVILRASSIYGYGLPKGKMIHEFLRQANEQQLIELDPPDDDRINFIHASDVVNAMIQAVEHQAWGVFNVGSPSECTIRRLAEVCAASVGRAQARTKEMRPNRSARIRFGVVSEKAKRAFGFSPSTPLEVGIKRMWRSMCGEFVAV